MKEIIVWKYMQEFRDLNIVEDLRKYSLIEGITFWKLMKKFEGLCITSQKILRNLY